MLLWCNDPHKIPIMGILDDVSGSFIITYYLIIDPRVFYCSLHSCQLYSAAWTSSTSFHHQRTEMFRFQYKGKCWLQQLVILSRPSAAHKTQGINVGLKSPVNSTGFCVPYAVIWSHKMFLVELRGHDIGVRDFVCHTVHNICRLLDLSSRQNTKAARTTAKSAERTSVWMRMGRDTRDRSTLLSTSSRSRQPPASCTRKSRKSKTR